MEREITMLKAVPQEAIYHAREGEGEEYEGEAERIRSFTRRVSFYYHYYPL